MRNNTLGSRRVFFIFFSKYNLFFYIQQVCNNFAPCFYCLWLFGRKRRYTLSANSVIKSIGPAMGDTVLIEALSWRPGLKGDQRDPADQSSATETHLLSWIHWEHSFTLSRQSFKQIRI